MLIHVFLLSLLAVCYADTANQIVRPCHYSNLKCIRENLVANSKCNGNVRGSVPSEYTIAELVSHAPGFNSSYIDYNLIVRNQNLCRVSEFFFNVQGDSAVIGIDCPNLQFESFRKLIQHRSLQEDTEYSYQYKGTYPLIRLTLNLKGADNMNICNTLAFADVTALPIFSISPANRKTANFLSRDLSLLNFFEREYIWWRANALARSYINSVLCDFGCNS